MIDAEGQQMRVMLHWTKDRGRTLWSGERQRWLALVCAVSASFIGCAPDRKGDPMRGTGGTVGAGGVDGISVGFARPA